jgi:hypothetical protein
VLSSNFIYRVVAFCTTKTYLTDLQSSHIETSRLANRIKAAFLASFATQMTLQNRRHDKKDSNPRPEQFQSVISIEIFNLRVSKRCCLIHL